MSWNVKLKQISIKYNILDIKLFQFVIDICFNEPNQMNESNCWDVYSDVWISN